MEPAIRLMTANGDLATQQLRQRIRGRRILTLDPFPGQQADRQLRRDAKGFSQRVEQNRVKQRFFDGSIAGALGQSQ